MAVRQPEQNQMMGMFSKAQSGGRSKAFRMNPTPETAAACLAALAGSMAEVTGLTFKSIIAAAATMTRPPKDDASVPSSTGNGTVKAGGKAPPKSNASTPLGYAVGAPGFAPYNGAYYPVTLTGTTKSEIRFTWDAGGDGVCGVNEYWPASVTAIYPDDGKGYPATIIGVKEGELTVKWVDDPTVKTKLTWEQAQVREK